MRKKKVSRSWVPSLLMAVGVFVVIWLLKTIGLLSMRWYLILQMAAITTISALGLNLIYGFNGQFSLGHIGFYAIGAYASALITKDLSAKWSGTQVGGLSWIMAGQLGVLATLILANKLKMGPRLKALRKRIGGELATYESGTITALAGILMLVVVLAAGVVVAVVTHWVFFALFSGLVSILPKAVEQPIIFFVALLNGGTLAALVSYLVGLPLLRLGSDYFGIATLGFAIMVYTALQSGDLVIPTMKGARGMVGIPHWTNWGWAFGALVLSLFVIRNLVYSSYGRAFLSVREDEVAARAMGVDVAQMKTMAFTFGGFFAGVAGGLYAHWSGFLHPSSFNMIRGFDPLIMIVFGGLGSMTGTLVGSMTIVIGLELLRNVLPSGFEDWRFVIYAILLLMIMLLRQQGLLGTNEWGWLKAPLPPERDIPVPTQAAVEGEEGA